MTASTTLLFKTYLVVASWSTNVREIEFVPTISMFDCGLEINPLLSDSDALTLELTENNKLKLILIGHF